MRASTRMPTPQPPRRRRSQMGLGREHPNNHSGHRCARPRTRGRKRLALRTVSRAQRWPVGCYTLLDAPAARRGWRIRARDCLSAAGASSSETPPAPSTAGCPAAQRRGRRQQVRLFFAYFLLAKQKKVSRPPGRDPASVRNKGEASMHRDSHENNSYQRLIHKHQSLKRPQGSSLLASGSTLSRGPTVPRRLLSDCGCPVSKAA